MTRQEREQRERLRATFDQAAELYDRARPRYPPALFEDLADVTGIGPGSRVLEIGPGTGQATLSLAERGCRVVAVELGPDLDAVARRNLARSRRSRSSRPRSRTGRCRVSRSTWSWPRPRSTGSTRPCGSPRPPTRSDPAARSPP